MCGINGIIFKTSKTDVSKILKMNALLYHRGPDDSGFINHKNLLDFGICIEEGKFLYNDNYCIIPIVDVLAYALGISNSGKANSIVLAGFDGYDTNDPRHNEMKNFFELYEKNKTRNCCGNFIWSNYTEGIFGPFKKWFFKHSCILLAQI